MRLASGCSSPCLVSLHKRVVIESLLDVKHIAKCLKSLSTSCWCPWEVGKVHVSLGGVGSDGPITKMPKDC